MLQCVLSFYSWKSDMKQVQFPWSNSGEVSMIILNLSKSNIGSKEAISKTK
jgi:formate-dependent nitrite reductase cytochrome c552 subunit